MYSLNSVNLIGHIGGIESKFTPSGMQITKFSLATSKSKKNSDNWETITEWHNIVSFDKKAKYAIETLKKGSYIFVNGELKTQSWEDDKGKHYKTEIIAHNLGLLEKREQETNNQQQNNNKDDLPF